MTQEALKLALDALEGVLDDAPKVLDASISGGLYEVVQCREAITAIKEALAQEQEPVAWMWDVNNGAGYSSKGIGFYQTDIPFAKHTPLYTTPPQRQWVGLTDEDKHEIELRAGITEDDDGYIVSQVFKLTEAKLKEKNT